MQAVLSNTLSRNKPPRTRYVGEVDLAGVKRVYEYAFIFSSEHAKYPALLLPIMQTAY